MKTTHTYAFLAFDDVVQFGARLADISNAFWQKSKTPGIMRYEPNGLTVAVPAAP